MRQTRTVVVRRPAALPLYILQILLSQEKFSPETSSASLFELNLILPNAEWTLRFIACCEERDVQTAQLAAVIDQGMQLANAGPGDLMIALKGAHTAKNSKPMRDPRIVASA